MRTTAIALAILLAGGCQAPRPTLVSDAAVILPLPVVRQDDLYECGLVSVSALCLYHRTPVPDADRERLVRLAAERRGLSGGELRTALERLGMDVWIFRGALDHSATGLYGHVDAGRPLLVMTDSPQGVGPHYSLFSGYDPELGNVHLLDPLHGQVVLPVAAFEHSWERAERFTLLAVPTDEPVTGEDP